MISSLIPEKPLQVSPSLAATIGLEEATMLAVLADLLQHRDSQLHQGYQWLELDEQTLSRFLPFWTDHDIQRISKNLQDKGIVVLASAPYTTSRVLHFALNEPAQSQSTLDQATLSQATSNQAAINQATSQQVTSQQAAFNQPAQQANHYAGQSQSRDNRALNTGGMSNTPSYSIPIVSIPNNGMAPQAHSAQTHTQAQAHNQQQRGANRIAHNWQPSDDLRRQIAQHNIPDHFVREQLPEFITYWSERAEPHHSWGSKFLKQVLRKWREHQTDFNRRDQETSMHSDWRPSHDAMEVMVKHAAINHSFVEDAIPEFILFWQERGEVCRTWNTKFIQHVRRQWARYSSALEHSTEPHRIPENWQPSEDVQDVLRLANIDLAFALQLVPEFVLFWRDSNQVNTSWNTKFLQHSKYHWAKRHSLGTENQLTHSSQQAGQHAGQQTAHHASRTRDRSLVDDLTDRSWAS